MSEVYGEGYRLQPEAIQVEDSQMLVFQIAHTLKAAFTRRAPGPRDF